MIGDIIAIGDELTSGRILNTTSGYAARKLFDAGHTIHSMNTIGDSPDLIGEALIRSIERVDFIIVTGGLGSTDDDITNVAVSHALNRPTIPDLKVLARIREHLGKHKISLNNPLEKLAWLPGGAETFDHDSFMAGHFLVHDNTPIFFLPGVPEEMKDLMSGAVLPKLAAWQAGSRLQTKQRIYKVFGIAESEINRRIKTLQLPDEIKIGYYPVYPDVHISVLLRSPGRQMNRDTFDASCQLLEMSLGDAVYGRDSDELESAVGSLLLQRGLRLSVAESCTGGLLCHRITRVAGSSDYFRGGGVTYSNELKHKLLGVDDDILSRYGAVSQQTAEAMAEGIKRYCSTQIGLSITGIAGPGGGSEDKPIGTVYIGIAGPQDINVKKYNFSGDRNRIQTIAVHTGLNMLRLFLSQMDSEKQTSPNLS